MTSQGWGFFVSRFGHGIAALAVAASAASAAPTGSTPALSICTPDQAPQASVPIPESLTPRPGSVLDSLLKVADRRAAEQGEDPAAARTRLLAHLVASNHCFVEFPTPEQLENIARLYDGLPPTVVQMRALTNRFFTDPVVWSGQAPLGEPAQTTSVAPNDYGPASPVRLSYSFPSDGVPWEINGPAVNDLNARLLAMFPNDGVDRGRELIRQSVAQWALACAAEYYELSDNNEPLSVGPSTPPTPLLPGNGDIRFGAFAQDVSTGVLAYNYLPQFGGDMTINSNFFPQYTAQSSTGYRYFRNAVAHEHGHGLGFLHSVPCNQTKLLEPFSSTVYDGPQVDELRGAQRLYGDRFSPNHESAAAHDLGTLVNASGSMGRSVREQGLSTNGPVTLPDQSPNPAGEDWFKFRLDGGQPVRITIRPTGGVYNNGPQDEMCNSTMITSEQAIRAGNLNFALYLESDLTSDIAHGRGGTRNEGLAEEVLFTSSEPSGDLSAGTYYLRVWDSGAPTLPDTNPVQLYDLEIRLGDPTNATSQFTYSPRAFAGIDKRISVNQPCYFIGDLLSIAREPGFALRTSQFEWDLDGDGIFEITNTPADPNTIPVTPTIPPNLLRQPVKTYTTNGVVPVTLRVTDDNGKVDTHTIMVTVVGAPITVTAVTPNFGNRMQTVPVIITGTNLGAVSDVSQITLTGGSGVVPTAPAGIMVMNGGTEIHGVEFVISDTAPYGFLNLRVTDGTSNATLPNAFEVQRVPMPPPNDLCPTPAVWDPMVVPNGTVSKPFNNFDATLDAGGDFTGTPCAPDGMFADVWYTWTSPVTGRLRINSRSLPDFSSRVAVYDTVACPPDLGSLLGCGVDGAAFEIAIAINHTYLFRVGNSTDTQGGMGFVDLTFIPTLGACCNPSGSCSITTRAACPSSNLFQGENTVCGSCPVPTGACCFPSGACATRTAAACTGDGGSYRGNGSACGTVFCPPPPPPTGACCNTTTGVCTITFQANCAAPAAWTQGVPCSTCVPNMGACCYPDGTCAPTTTAGCLLTGGTYQGDATACAAVSCPPPPPAMGACCDTFSGACVEDLATNCTGFGQSYLGDFTTCSPNDCPQPPPGACCELAGCRVTTQALCNGSFTPLQVCSPDPCPILGACCRSAGTCTGPAPQSTCTGIGAVFQGRGSVCTPGLCPVTTAACCAANGTCLVTDPPLCSLSGGTSLAAGTTCSPNMCPPPVGSCCRGTICTRVSEATCVGGRWGGPGTTCASPDCCQADVNGQDGLSIQDVFDYLNVWFIQDDSAEFDGIAGITLDDLFGFMNAFFAGCAP